MKTLTPNELAVIDSTIGLNGPEHDLPLELPQTFSFAKAAKFNPGSDGGMRTGRYKRAEWRGAIYLPHQQPLDRTITVTISGAAYWSWTPTEGWVKQFDVVMRQSGNGGYLGAPGATRNPYKEPSRGNIRWTPTAGGNGFTATWAPGQSDLMHFWAGKRHPFTAGQQAELSTGWISVSPTHGSPVLGGIGVDYYNANENNNEAPGPGIQRYKLLSGTPTLHGWLTLPPGVPRTPDGYHQWIADHPLPLDAPTPPIITPPIDPPVDPPTTPPTTIDQLRTEMYTQLAVVTDLITNQSAILDSISLILETHAARLDQITLVFNDLKQVAEDAIAEWQ